MVPVAKIKEAISRGANKEEENAKTPIGRSLKHLIEVVTDLEKWGLGFKSLTENIDTTTSGGKLFFHIFGALAKFERNLIRERTQAWLEAARARGYLGGSPKALATTQKIAMAQKLYNDKSNSM